MIAEEGDVDFPQASTAGARKRAQLTNAGTMAYRRASALIGLAEDVATSASTDLRTLDAQLAIVNGLMRERLAAPDQDLDRADVVDLSQAIAAVHMARFDIHDHIGHDRLRRLDALETGLSALRRVPDQDALLDVACESVAVCGGFDRVMLSKVDDDIWRPWRSFARVDTEVERAFARWMQEVPEIHLQHMLLESAMVRRREPTIVLAAAEDPRVYAPMAEASGLSSYVAAPIVAGERVIGLLHADYRGGEVTPLDRDILWAFAVGFAQIFERSVLLARLRDQRAEVMQVMKTVEAVLDDLASAEIDLSTREQASTLAIARPVLTPGPGRWKALEAILTPREVEVLGLMATGATNDRIAQRLVIANGTVKSHVKNILRKLRAENRAEAISQYLRLTIGDRLT